MRIAVQQVLLQIVHENARRDALELEMFEVAAQEGIEFLAPELLLEAPQK